MSYMQDSYKEILKSIEEGKTFDFFDSYLGFSFFYDINSKKYFYCQNNDLVDENDPRDFFQIIEEDHLASKAMLISLQNKIESFLKQNEVNAESINVYIKNKKNIFQYYTCNLVKRDNLLFFIFFNITKNVVRIFYEQNSHDYDSKTGLFIYNIFCRKLNARIANGELNHGSIVYFDLMQFQAFKDTYGYDKGDALLSFIAETLMKYLKMGELACRIHLDHFVFYCEKTGKDLINLINQIDNDIMSHQQDMEIFCNFGIYEINENTKIEEMVDRAIIAYETIKEDYNVNYAYFTSKMREVRVREQEYISGFSFGINNHEFILYYQPQYNHMTGRISGAEALVRWNHPKYGLIAPGEFIPLFEKNGSIVDLDLYVFEQTCIFIKKCIDQGIPFVPISVNISRLDIFQVGFIDKLEAIRNKINVPVSCLRIEITESSIYGNINVIDDFVNKLHSYHYVVEMDDFGSGYSSLNVLKDIYFDVIKMDMKFLYDEKDHSRSGIIISSIVRMAKRLGIPLVAEGVEKISQSEFLKSIGCEFVQGYLFSLPLPEEQYISLISSNQSEVFSQSKKDNKFATIDFWSPYSSESMIFDQYLSAAAIIELNVNNDVEILRVNEKYIKEMMIDKVKSDLISMNAFEGFDENNKKIYLDTLHRALETDEEETCITIRKAVASNNPQQQIRVSASIRVVERHTSRYIFYVLVRNLSNNQ